MHANRRHVVLTALPVLAGLGIVLVEQTARAQDCPTSDTADFSTVRGASSQSQDFLNSVTATANNIGVTPQCLGAIMSFETGGTFSTGIRNPGSAATGLIQFTGSTAVKLLGWANTPANRAAALSTFAGMSQTQQLQYVQQYFTNAGFSSSNFSNCGQAYLTVFAGAGSKNVDFNSNSGVLYSMPAGGCAAGARDPYCLNSNNGTAGASGRCGLDLNCDGDITGGEVVSGMIGRGDSGYFPDAPTCVTVTATFDPIATEDADLSGLTLTDTDQGDDSGACQSDACGYADGYEQGGTDEQTGGSYDPGAGGDAYDVGWGGGGYSDGWSEGYGGGCDEYCYC